MVDQEENILLPMSLDVLDEREWWEIARQSDEIGYCLVEPEAPGARRRAPTTRRVAGARVKLPTGSLAPEELEAILGALPLDATFVDAEDRVRWFSHGRTGCSRAAARCSAARCSSATRPRRSTRSTEILAGFRAGTQDRAAFWIELRGRFVHIEYRALRDGPARTSAASR